MRYVLALVFGIFATTAAVANEKPTLKINGSTTVNPVVAEAAEIFKKNGWRMFVDTQGGSSGGIAYVAEGMCDIGAASRDVSDHDRKKFPKADFTTHTVGYDGVAMVVSKDLYDAGVQKLTKTQIKGIYEGKITNWQTVGGPDRKIVFFNKEPGRGTWEVFAKFLYGKAKKAPKVFHPEVGANQEARTKVANHKGGVTQLSAAWAWDSPGVEALAIVNNGKAMPATLANIASGDYPMRRPLNLITKGKANKNQQQFIDFILSPKGQKIVEKNGYLAAKPQTGS